MHLSLCVNHPELAFFSLHFAFFNFHFSISISQAGRSSPGIGVQKKIRSACALRIGRTAGLRRGTVVDLIEELFIRSCDFVGGQSVRGGGRRHFDVADFAEDFQDFAAGGEHPAVVPFVLVERLHELDFVIAVFPFAGGRIDLAAALHFSAVDHDWEVDLAPIVRFPPTVFIDLAGLLSRHNLNFRHRVK